MKKQLLLLFWALLCMHYTYAQCPPGQIEVKVEIKPDNYPAEVSWQLKDKFGNVIGSSTPGMAANTVYTTAICTNSAGCLALAVTDGYGDGICCSYGVGYVKLYVNGVLTYTNGGTYGAGFNYNFNCGPGESCATAFTVPTGTYTAPGPEYNYKFKPTQPGLFKFSTCGHPNVCDTKIWVYDNCTAPRTQNNTGTLYYNDDYCGSLSEITAAVDTTKTYYVRIGAANNGGCTSPIEFEISYVGPIPGCTDPLACNYNPVATVNDGTCKYYPDPTCQGPDLTIDQNMFQSSMYLSSLNAPLGDCRVVEGCLNGYGNRTIIRFGTYIKNIGDLDYYIGNPSLHPNQFSFANCHGHAHYEGYAEYRLYKPSGQAIPIGFKNGFCVLDYDGCPGGGTAKYGCGNMGISNGCGDIYSAGLDCQWIDITDVDTGQYIMATKVNWDQSPDALGHYEKTYTNNWVQVCIRIMENTPGVKTYSVLPNCQPYVDCAGVQYGNSVFDCNGTCGGTVKMGDLDVNGQQQVADAQAYVTGILNNALTPTSCNDLNNTNSLTVWDAALMVDCSKNGGSTNSKCQFPRGVLNPNHTVIFSVGNFNPSQNYFDVYMSNPTAKILGYEFTISGATILNAVNLAPAATYPANPEFIVGGNKVICLSYVDSTIGKSIPAQPLVRIYYANSGSTMCIDNVIEVVDKEHEATLKGFSSSCIITTGLETAIDADNYFSAVPNPANEYIDLTGHFKKGEDAQITIHDLSGRIVYSEKTDLQNMFNHRIDLSNFNSGLYIVNITTTSGTANKPIVVTK